MNGAAVFAGVDDAHHRREQLSQVGCAADLLQDSGMLELRLERDGVGKLAALDATRNCLIDAAVDRVREVVW